VVSRERSAVKNPDSSLVPFLYPSLFIFTKEKTMTTVKYSVPNINCMHCVHTIQTELADVQGVQSVKADAANKMVEIVFDTPASESQIKALLAEINYPVAV
jgi:copper chaperone